MKCTKQARQRRPGVSLSLSHLPAVLRLRVFTFKVNNNYDSNVKRFAVGSRCDAIAAVPPRDRAATVQRRFKY